MSYLERLREGRYVSPSGREFPFAFDDLGRSGGKKAAVSELPQQDAADIQDLGLTAHRFAMKIYFSGADYDREADGFYKALGERGPGTLKHPRWGDLSVLATTFDQSEQFVDGMGRAVFDVEFIFSGLASAEEAATVKNASDGKTTAAAVSSAAVSARENRKKVFVDAYKNPTVTELSGTISTLKGVARNAKKSFYLTLGTLSTASQKFSAALKKIEYNAEALVSAPGELYDAVSDLISAPAETAGNIVLKTYSYSVALAAIVNDPIPRIMAAGRIIEAVCIAVIDGASSCVIEGSLSSRDEAIASRENITSTTFSAISALERLEREIPGLKADPETLQAAVTLSTVASSYALEASFSLRAVRKVTLDGAATALELVYRFYGSIEKLDEFIAQNNLIGDQILIVPAGTEVRYYVE